MFSEVSRVPWGRKDGKKQARFPTCVSLLLPVCWVVVGILQLRQQGNKPHMRVNGSRLVKWPKDLGAVAYSPDVVNQKLKAKEKLVPITCAKISSGSLTYQPMAAQPQGPLGNTPI